MNLKDSGQMNGKLFQNIYIYYDLKILANLLIQI